MELTGKKLEEILKAELVGKEVGYSNYTFYYTVNRVVQAVAKEIERDPASFGVKDYRYISKNTVGITYMGSTIGEASFKKQKGKYKYGGYEWTFKDIQVLLYNESGYYYTGLTFDEMLTKVYQDNQKAQDKEAQKLEQAKRIFQKIKEELGTTSNYEVKNFIEYMNSKRYSLYE